MDIEEKAVPKKISRPQTRRDIEWNEKLEIAAKDIGEASKGYKLMHIRQAQKSIKTYNNLMIAGVMMGPMAGVASGIGAAINSGTDPTIPIIAVVLGFLSGIVVTIMKFGKYDENSNANKQAAARYTSIESNVRRQLGLYRVDRVPATPYMEWLETKYEELFSSAPLLPASMYDKYSNFAKDVGLSVPTRYEPVITINTDYETTKVREIIDTTDIEVNSFGESIIHEELEDIEKGSKKANKQKNIKKTIKRTGTMSQFPDLNKCSDQMLNYEMKRMMGFSN